MPLVHIHFARSSSAQQRVAVGDAVHRALVDALAIPPEDHFQIISPDETLVFDERYLGIHRGPGFLTIQIHLARGRTVGQKKALYARIAELLGEGCGVRPEDVFVNLVETGPEDFSFGNGLAQYAESMPPHLAPRVAAQG